MGLGLIGGLIAHAGCQHEAAAILELGMKL